MNIDLFEHNKTAYHAAVKMLEGTGKAAVIHPTGTGKSFIGFQLCIDHLDEPILWLSPSKYIYDTQLENLAQVTGGELPDNITFLTYAKLMLMDEEEIKEFRPACIILDEFHCCGAQMWGQGVQRLLSVYPHAPILGLSATNIRYLDNQRDMAKEMFDGNIASEITLGEAIVREILNPPKYVLSIFKYESDLMRYEDRLKRERSKVVRDQGRKVLDALRRALEKADGLDVIFDKHMTDRTGKYIVFCANKSHMDEMMQHMEWFAKVDKHPHVYSLYTADPSTSQAFADFKADDDDSHLRLLYCIDALNQGIHVDDISGVILLRPTVSPTVYKQQIGRALSASKKKDAVIFDIVLNIENLYSIGAIEEEMAIATTYYRSLGEKEEIIHEHFRVIDEVRDCLELFEKLNDILTASWNLMYEKAAEYYKENGNLQIPKRYYTEDGYALGQWVTTQRSIHSGSANGSLSEEQIEKLDKIGMIWENRSDLSWKKNFAEAKAYYEEHGALDVPVDYVSKNGIYLGEWLRTIRKWKNAGVKKLFLTEERIEALDAIGMVWDKQDYYWEKNFQAAEEYYKEHGNLDVPSRYVTKDGLRLGSWISRQKALCGGKIKGNPPTKEQMERLNAIGMDWKEHNALLWERNFEAAKEYYQIHGNGNIPEAYTSHGLKVGDWVVRQKMYLRNGRLPEEKVKRLASIGIFVPRKAENIKDAWKYRFEIAKRYLANTGAGFIPQDFVMDGIWIGKWLAVQRKAMEEGKLSSEKEAMLRQIPLRTRSEQAWEEAYRQAADYYEEHGNLQISRRYKTAQGFGLGSWVSRQRLLRQEGKLSREQISRLDSIGFIWELEKVAG